MRFGTHTLTRAPVEQLVERWRWFEELGFDAAWVDDDLIAESGVSDFEAWTLLGALARETSRLRIGTLVSSIPFRHPAFLAAQAITVDHLSGGRARVGLGSGGCCPEFNELVGHSEWSPAERADRFEEQVVVLAGLLRGEPITHKGRYYPTVVRAMPQPIQRPRPRLTLAAHGPRGLRLAARYADGWNCFGGQPYDGPTRTFTRALAETRRLLERLDESCVEVGRDPATLERSIFAFRVEPDPFSSLGWFDEYVGGYRELGISEIVFSWPPMGHHRAGDPPVSTRILETFERIASERIC
jgi:alkanesulfonate monooxygenase SsuD/methylene tetrahydromethanopterin reductase-like flavin-dependent oxidoreductase (luciferase family)